MGYGFNDALDKLSLHFIYASKESLIHVIIFFSKDVWIYQVFYILLIDWESVWRAQVTRLPFKTVL